MCTDFKEFGKIFEVTLRPPTWTRIIALLVLLCFEQCADYNIALGSKLIANGHSHAWFPLKRKWNALMFLSSLNYSLELSAGAMNTSSYDIARMIPFGSIQKLFFYSIENVKCH